MKFIPLSCVAAIALLTPFAYAGYGGMGNIESENGSSGGGGFAIVAIFIGAAIGYVVERAYKKSKLDKSGIEYSSEYLGGKAGAIVGAIALPLLVGLMR